MGSRPQPRARVTQQAVALLGVLIAQARRERGWSAEELARRMFVSKQTVLKIEHGGMGVGIGTVFEAAYLTGVPLFEGPREVPRHLARERDRLALLPERIRPKQVPVDDDF